MEKFRVIVTTDGACFGNPGPGGYSYILRFGTQKKSFAGLVERSTNNRMELKAVIEAARALKKPCDITLRTDSKYVIDGVNSMFTNADRHWVKATGGRYANADLWQELVDIAKTNQHTFQCVKVYAHTGDEDNEECDRLAKEQILLRA